MNLEQGIESSEDRLGRVQSLVRAFGILDVLAEQDGGLTLIQISKRAKLPRSTAHRLLSTMGALGYVQFNQQNNHWSIGLQAFTVGSAFSRARDLGQLGRPIMRSLMLEARETVNIAIPKAEGVYFVAQVEAAGVRPTMARPGAQLPIHTTAAGKAQLAHWHKDELDRFLTKRSLFRATDRTITEPSQLVANLSDIQRLGYAVDDQENAAGTRCIAAPVFDENGYPTASLSISGPIARLGDDRIDQLGRALAVAARRMTGTIGGRVAA